VNFADGTIRFLIPGAIYQINPKTGHATFVAPMNSPLSTMVDVGDTVYAFNGVAGEVVSLDVETGQTSVVSTVDPAVTPVAGAAPARPVPAAIH
jgi:outer membrane protein assembly factor BamB